jgi:3'(2'), 5'-bisphosphate nucleotidase
MADYRRFLRLAIDAALAGGEKIMEVYDSIKINVILKKDFSPLTEADLKSNEIIKKYLEETGLPLLSEEEKEIAYKKRKDWDLFWLVDPLDGTKEFIKRNGEFAVNIALIEKNAPVIGVIYAPAAKDLYFSYPGSGSYKISEVNPGNIRNKTLKSILALATPLPVSARRDRYTAIGSRSHMSLKTWTYFRKLQKNYRNTEILKIGSSLKLCLMAEGKADVYPRFSHTMEWDIAAGHAIIEGAGFMICEYRNKKPLIYNKENLRNPFFIAGKPEFVI